MATIQLNPVFEGLSRKVGDLVFFKRNGETYVRRRGEHRDAKTEAQMRVRTAFTRLVKIWHYLGMPMQACWDDHVKDERYTGYNAFIGANATAQREGRALTLAPAARELHGFSAVPGKAGEITCALQQADSSNVTTLFTQKVGDDTGCGLLRRHEWGQGTGTVLGGLEAGTYHVYAVTTDVPYDESLSLISLAVQTVTVA